MTDLTMLPNKLTEAGECRAIVETSRGSTSKIDYDRETGLFRLRHVLAAGMCFPLDFGFIPSTEGEDGDPLDVMLLAEEALFPGCLVDVRLIGVLEGCQTTRDGTYRNDRLLAVPVLSRRYAELKEIARAPPGLCDELAAFWRNYNDLRGRTFELLRIEGAARAADLVRRAGADR